jgi:hypothetical protein
VWKRSLFRLKRSRRPKKQRNLRHRASPLPTIPGEHHSPGNNYSNSSVAQTAGNRQAAKGGLTGLSPLPENGDPNVKGGASRRRQTIAGSRQPLTGGGLFRIIPFPRSDTIPDIFTEQ